MWIEKVTAQYTQWFGQPPELVVSAPGRMNLIGEHTDYSEGFVMPAAIDKRLYFALGRTNTSQLRLNAVNMGEVLQLPVDQNEPVNASWANYLIGVIQEMQARQPFELPGLNVAFGGDIPEGAGLSSSAALEVGFAFGLEQLFQPGLDAGKLIEAAQMAEHHYAGVQCGIMDQFASMRGKKDHVFQLDCRTLDYEYHPLQLSAYDLVLCNTHVQHSLASSAYNQRKDECHRAAEFFRTHGYSMVSSLRDVTPAMLTEHQHEMEPVVWKRAHHVVHENARVLETSRALQAGQIQRVGELLYESHQSLSADFAVSCPELDFLVDQTKNNSQVAGARMMGGGFGGCTLNLVAHEHRQAFEQQLRDSYEQAFGLEPSFYQVHLDDGPKIHS